VKKKMVELSRVKTAKTDKTLFDVEWPNGFKCAVSIQFDYDSSVGALFRGVHAVQASMGEFGPRVGIWRILNMLDRCEVKATFFIPGITAELYPESVKEIAKRGHEIACHNYAHRDVSTFKVYDEEKAMHQKCIDVLQGITGQRPIGWKKSGGALSPNTLNILNELGFSYVATGMADDIPYYWNLGEGKEILVLPNEWTFDDALFFMYSGAGKLIPGTPSTPFEIWTKELNEVYKQGRYLKLGFHPFIIGRLYRIALFEEFLNLNKSNAQVWFARCDQIAKYWKKKYPST